MREKRIAIESAKEYLRKQFRLKGVRVVEYERIEPLSYEMEMTKLCSNILIYIIRESKPKEAHKRAERFCNSCTIDFEI